MMAAKYGSMGFPVFRGRVAKLGISKHNCRAATSPKKQTKHTQDTILSLFCSFLYPECNLFVFWERLQLDNFVSRSTDIYSFRTFWHKKLALKVKCLDFLTFWLWECWFFAKNTTLFSIPFLKTRQHILPYCQIRPWRGWKSLLLVAPLRKPKSTCYYASKFPYSLS